MIKLTEDKPRGDGKPNSAVSAQTTKPVVESTQLFGGGKELLIHHAGECYTLRQTSKGRLILTK